jgi:hypothetical protein
MPPGSQIALKGLAIKVGENGEAAVAYDLDLCRMIGAWTGGKFVTPMNLSPRAQFGEHRRGHCRESPSQRR